MKKWIWLLLILTITECIIFFYMNYKVYAGVIATSIFIQLFIVQLFFSIYAIRKSNDKKKHVFLKVGFGIAIVTIVIYMIAMPKYTYIEAQRLVMMNYDNKAKLISTNERTIPATEADSWLLYEKLYYVKITDSKQNQDIYYIVYPKYGKIEKLDEPYW